MNFSPRAQALVIDRPGESRMTAYTASAPKPGDVLVRVHAVGICGSDREVFHGTRPEGYVRYPVVPGHEWSGTVEAVGEGVSDALTGRRVVAEGFRNCQVCDRCRAGETSLCTAGYEETGFTLPGAMADTVTVPARLLHVLPDDADPTAAALLEPAACAAAAALRADVRPGERVAVVGTGTLGLLSLQLLAASSPAELLAVGRHAAHADRARRCGATAFTEPGSAPGEFDVVVEAAGSPGSARAAAGMLRRGGRLVLTGIAGSGAAGLDPTDLVVRRLDVRTVFGATPAAWAHAVRAFAAGLLDPSHLVTHRFPVTEFARAIELVGADDPEVGKVLLFPGAVPEPSP
ncbi:alcohol dehydrogenase catalytic domain-containing protein [Yinghuangia sp. ASG 101]|uniref:zinc-dependent alcohol dehydrogenase n=1 Tax=Yinghuangia sp. ASG 101 TaxID=2896848 RepID=UPI001E637187|nr:alcohol dehydrogenase catalytic domain-containing protein [Yinghuangia sp. ASG 101]UGQ10855.1 alcohol dehydrogenase catalytic domain-containing protein [Yinghuangia sp. ASG 101]